VRRLYEATLEFEATNPISGRKRRVSPGEFFVADAGQTGASVLIEIDESLWLVEADALTRCAVVRPPSAGGTGL